MKHTTYAESPNLARGHTTNEFADLMSLQPQSIRKRYSQTGSYFGVTPIKLPNGRLSWPANVIELLTKSVG